MGLYDLLVRLFSLILPGRSLYAHRLRRGSFDLNIMDHGTPVARETLRVAHLSDFHAGPFLDSNSLKDVVNSVNDLDPHVLVLTGDYITRSHKDLDLILDALSELRFELGAFAVFGNHDYRLRKEQYMVDRFKEMGIQTLRNEACPLNFKGKRFFFLGIEDIEEGKYPDLTTAIRGATGDGYKILLAHNPDVVKLLNAPQVDLVLAGHTHGGQIRFPLIRALGAGYDGEYMEGLHHHNGISVYVNRGLGCLVLPFRIKARAEVTLHRLPVQERI